MLVDLPPVWGGCDMSRYLKLQDAMPGGMAHAFALANNVAQAVDRRMPEAKALASWMDQDRTRPCGQI